MTRTIEIPNNELLDEGIYAGTLASVHEGNGKFGPNYKWTWRISDPETGDVELTQITSQKLGNTATSRMFVEALSGRSLSAKETVDLDDLIGRSARLTIKPNERGYSEVANAEPSSVSMPVAGEPVEVPF